MTKRMVIEVPDGFERLGRVYQLAIEQATGGKGVERHGSDSQGRVLAFADQPTPRITRVRGTGYPLGQCDKKTEEAALLLSRDEDGKAQAELLGAMNFIAFALDALLEGDV